MSTRCNVLVKSQDSHQWFYRHSDGYPSCTANNLKIFVQWLVDGKIRNNVTQGSPWLIVLGNKEYVDEKTGGGYEPSGGSFGWKVGSYELTDGQHSDIDWLYTIDMSNKTVQVENIDHKNVDVYSFDDFLKTNFSD